MMDFSFEDHAYNRLISKAGISDKGSKALMIKAIIPMAVCWIPLAIITALNGTFWTGDITTSFITSFNTQTGFLISIPIFIMAERQVTLKLALILNQFMNSGIVPRDEHDEFLQIIKKRTRFMKSHWTDLAVLLICYVQVFIVLSYESSSTSLLSWQMNMTDGENTLNFVGFWSTAIARPFLLFLFYRWLLRIFVWGMILYNISRLHLNLFAVHPDLCGGLGFLGYSIRYFSPVAFAISVTVAGNIADFMLIEGMHLVELKYTIAGYILFITLLFTLPLMSFIGKLIDVREKSIFENYDYTNGIFRELRIQMSKGFYNVDVEDLKKPYYSSAADISTVIENALKMKFIPFTLKDMIPILVMSLVPFLGVVIIDVPVAELFKTIISFVM